MNAPGLQMRFRLCLVEPDSMSLRNLVAIFEQAEYEVTAYSGAEEALEGMSGQAPHLLLSEWELETEGELFCRSVCDRFPGLPVIFLSQNHDPDSRLAAVKCGALDYLIKPFNRDFLVSKVASAIRVAVGNGPVDRTLRGSPEGNTGPGFTEFLRENNKEIAIPVPDPESPFGFSYPSVSSWHKELSSPEAQIEFLEGQVRQGQMSREVYDIIKTCVSCNSINLSVRQICSECKFPIQNADIRLNRTCEKCGAISGDTVSIRCLSCLEEFEQDKANELTIYAYQVSSVTENQEESPLWNCLHDNGLKAHNGRLLADFLRLETCQHRAAEKPFAVMKLHFNTIQGNEDFSRELRKLGHIILLLKKTMQTNDILFFLHPDQLVVFSAYQEIEPAKARNEKFGDVLARLKLDSMVELTASSYDPRAEENIKTS